MPVPLALSASDMESHRHSVAHRTLWWLPSCHEKAPHIHCHSRLPAALCCLLKKTIFTSRADKDFCGLLGSWPRFHRILGLCWVFKMVKRFSLRQSNHRVEMLYLDDVSVFANSWQTGQLTFKELLSLNLPPTHCNSVWEQFLYLPLSIWPEFSLNGALWKLHQRDSLVANQCFL